MMFRSVFVGMALFAALGSAQAAPLDGAFRAGDYPRAIKRIAPAAERGNARAQAYLGFMYQYGRGVAQNYPLAVYWYRRGAQQGNATAQHLLGLMFDKGQGVRQNYIEAHKWLNLATAHAPPRAREYSARLRDAVETKMTRGEIGVARLRAAEWAPVFEHPPIGVAR